MYRVIFAFFCVLSLLLLLIFDDGTIFGGNPSRGEPIEEQTKTVQRKKVEVECGKDSETSFNGHTVKLTALRDDNPICKTDSLIVDGKELVDKLEDNGVGIYEFFDDYLVFDYGNTSMRFLGVYNIKTEEFKSYSPEEMEYFMISDWQSDDNGITFPECHNVKAQAMPEGETNDHNTEFAEFRMDYKDGVLSDPKFVKEFGNPYQF